MKTAVFKRKELQTAHLQLGKLTIDLADYATTGVRTVVVAPSGCGKTNAGLVIAEQLAQQGWQCVIFTAGEGEVEALYGAPVRSPEELLDVLEARSKPFVTVDAKDATEFAPYAAVVMEVADEHRKPLFVLIDEGATFSASRKRKDGMGESSAVIDSFFLKGRKRCLDIFITASSMSGSLSRTAFQGRNITLIGHQEDAACWASLAPAFRGTGVGFNDLLALAPGEFYCFSRSGLERISMQMSAELAKVAPAVKRVRQSLPRTFGQWDSAMRRMPLPRLKVLSPEIIGLLGQVSGLTTQQMISGNRALFDEIGSR